MGFYGKNTSPRTHHKLYDITESRDPYYEDWLYCYSNGGEKGLFIIFTSYYTE